MTYFAVPALACCTGRAPARDSSEFARRSNSPSTSPDIPHPRFDRPNLPHTVPDGEASHPRTGRTQKTAGRERIGESEGNNAHYVAVGEWNLLGGYEMIRMKRGKARSDGCGGLQRPERAGDPVPP